MKRADQRQAEEARGEIDEVFDFLENRRKPAVVKNIAKKNRARLYADCFPANVALSDSFGSGQEVYLPSLEDVADVDFRVARYFFTSKFGGDDTAKAIRVRRITHRDPEARAAGLPMVANMYDCVVFMWWGNGRAGAFREVVGVSASGNLVASRPPASRIAHGMVDRNSAGHESSASYAERLLRVTAGLALTSRYDWHVQLESIHGGHPVRIPTDATGARSLLSLRDVPDGKQRRAALKHWVSDHYRTTPSGGEAFVPEFMRGRSEFTWDEYRGVVIPSDFDRERYERRDERKAVR